MASKITLDPIDFYLMDTFVLFVVQEERKSYRFDVLFVVQEERKSYRFEME